MNIISLKLPVSHHQAEMRTAPCNTVLSPYLSKAMPIKFGAVEAYDPAALTGFLTAITGDPEEALHRLVLADWLEEHGCEKSGALLRKQAAWGQANPGEAGVIQAEIAVLEPQAQHEWNTLLAHQLAATGGSIARFYEGLPVVHIKGRDLLEKVANLSQLPGVALQISLEDVPLSRVLAHPFLRNIIHLELYNTTNYHNDLGAPGTRLLSAAPNLAQLRSLELGGHDIGSAGAQALANSKILTQLRSLHLSWNEIGDTGARALARAKNLTRLRFLDLSANNITSAGIRALTGSTTLSQLRTISFFQNTQVRGITALEAAIRRHGWEIKATFRLERGNT